MRLRRYRTKSNLSPFALPRGQRAVGLLLMVAGVAGFFLSRLLFGEQVLFLFASTVLTFGGLAIIVRAKKNQQAEAENSGEEYAPAEPRSRAARRASAFGNASAAPAPVRPRYASADSLPPLAARVTRIFRQQGAQVAVETQREDRFILQVTSPLGEVFTAMILEGADDVDATDVRALYALVSAAGNTGGYLIASGAFTERAEAWAQGKPLRLISEAELGDLTV